MQGCSTAGTLRAELPRREGLCLAHFKAARPRALAVDAPHLEQHLLQVLHPGDCVKERAGQARRLQALPQVQPHAMVQPQLHSAILHVTATQ